MSEKHPLRWSNEINLGHVLQLCAMIGVASVWFLSLDKRITANETRIESFMQRMDSQEATSQRQYDILLDEIRMLRVEIREDGRE